MSKLLSCAIALVIPIFILPSPSLARNKTDNVQFFCGRVNQNGKIIPTTQAVSSGTVEPVSLILWQYTPPQGMTNQQRCETVSQRFQLAWDRGTFDKLIVGIDKKTGMGIVCAVPYAQKECTRSHLLFTLGTFKHVHYQIIDRTATLLSKSPKISIQNFSNSMKRKTKTKLKLK